MKGGKYVPFSTWAEEETLKTFRALVAAAGLKINHCVTDALDHWNQEESERQRSEKRGQREGRKV